MTILTLWYSRAVHNRFITALKYAHLAVMDNCKILCRFKCLQCVLTNCSVVLKDYDNGKFHYGEFSLFSFLWMKTCIHGVLGVGCHSFR